VCLAEADGCVDVRFETTLFYCDSQSIVDESLIGEVAHALVLSVAWKTSLSRSFIVQVRSVF